MLERLILIALQRINGERTVNNVYHLFTGKRSIQTIQDANLFQLEAYFGIAPYLSYNLFQEKVKALQYSKRIHLIKKDTFHLTEEGKKSLQQSFPYPLYYQGMEYATKEREWLRRLTLMIQVWTNQQRQITRYIPIVDHLETQRWVKAYYRKLDKPARSYLQKLYDECVKLLEDLPDMYIEMFIKQLTTAEQIGWTKEQLANLYSISPVDVELHEINYLHYMLGRIEKEPRSYPLLYAFAKDLYRKEESGTITQSARITKTMITKGMSIEDVARFRRLKVTTIHDHLVEIALQDPSFPLDAFVPPSVQEEILQAVDSLATFKLKDIKERVSESISYFQIRLTLTALKHRTKEGSHEF